MGGGKPAPALAGTTINSLRLRESALALSRWVEWAGWTTKGPSVPLFIRKAPARAPFLSLDEGSPVAVPHMRNGRETGQVELKMVRD